MEGRSTRRGLHVDRPDGPASQGGSTDAGPGFGSLGRRPAYGPGAKPLACLGKDVLVAFPVADTANGRDEVFVAVLAAPVPGMHGHHPRTPAPAERVGLRRRHAQEKPRHRQVPGFHGGQGTHRSVAGDRAMFGAPGVPCAGSSSNAVTTSATAPCRCHSAGGGNDNCVEVASLTSESVAWRKSSRSNGGGGTCVEVAFVAAATAVRDSKDPEGTAFVFGPSAWSSFLDSVKAGQFDL